MDMELSIGGEGGGIVPSAAGVYAQYRSQDGDSPQVHEWVGQQQQPSNPRRRRAAADPSLSQFRLPMAAAAKGLYIAWAADSTSDDALLSGAAQRLCRRWQTLAAVWAAEQVVEWEQHPNPDAASPPFAEAIKTSSATLGYAEAIEAHMAKRGCGGGVGAKEAKVKGFVLQLDTTKASARRFTARAAGVNLRSLQEDGNQNSDPDTLQFQEVLGHPDSPWEGKKLPHHGMMEAYAVCANPSVAWLHDAGIDEGKAVKSIASFVEASWGTMTEAQANVTAGGWLKGSAATVASQCASPPLAPAEATQGLRVIGVDVWGVLR